MATVNDYTRTTWQTGDVIDATKMNNIETQLDAVTDNARDNGTAPVFSTTKTYAVGEHVLYNGEVYKCKTAVTNAGAWVASNWVKAYLSSDMEGEVSELKSAVQSYETLLNTSVSTRVLSAYVDATSRSLKADANSRTYLIDITSTDIDFYKVTTDRNNNRFRVLAFTKSIGDVAIGNVGTYTDLGNSTKTATFYKSDYPNISTLAIATNYQSLPLAEISIYAHSTENLIDEVSNLNTSVSSFSKAMESGFIGEVIVADSVPGDIRFVEIPQVDCTVTSIGKNLFNYETAEYGTIDASTGEDSSSWMGAVRSEDYVPVLPSTNYCISTVKPIYWFRMALYDENKTFLRRIEKQTGDGVYNAVLKTSDDAKYARLQVNVSSYNKQPSYTIQSVGIMFAIGLDNPALEDYATSSVTVSSGVVSGQLKSFSNSTLVYADYETTLNVNIPVNVSNLIKMYHPQPSVIYTEEECRARFRLAMTEKAKRIGMDGATIGDGGGYPVITQFTALDAIKMLIHALGYSDINDTWTYNTKIIRTKEVVKTITMNSTLFTDAYISDLTDYYDVLGFKTGSGSLHNLVCACTSNALEGKVLVGCISLRQVADDANINRPKAMKVLMDLGLARVADRNADVSAYVSQLTAMTANRFTVVLLPNCNNPRLLARYDFNSQYSMLYNHSSAKFVSFSMIKLLCAMTALDYLDDLDEEHAVVYSDLLIGTGAYGPLFAEGEVITFRDALSALLIPSCNQAAYFLERIVGRKILEKYGADGFLPTE